MKYFRVYTGYTEYIPIDEKELEKALYAFMTGNPIIFNEGSTSRIDRIIPDFHRAMGINPAWKFAEDDWNECDKQGHRKDYAGVIAHYKNRVQFLIDSGKKELIGKSVDIPELKAPNVEKREGKVKSIGEIIEK